MIPFVRDGDRLVAEFEPFEVALVTSLVQQVNDLIGPLPEAEPDPADPFAAWASELAAPPATLDRSDPVIERLFPDASTDEDVSAEVRRFSEEGLRRGRLDDAAVVLADLATTQEGEHPLDIPDDHAEAWLKTLNGLRVALSVRLGIDTQADHDALEALPRRDPRHQLVSLFDWLAVVLESLLEALHAPR